MKKNMTLPKTIFFISLISVNHVSAQIYIPVPSKKVQTTLASPFLKNTSNFEKEEQRETMSVWMDEKTQVELRDEYRQMSKDYVLKERSGLLRYQDRLSRIEQLKNYSENLTRNVLKNRFKKTVRKTAKDAKQESKEIAAVADVTQEVANVATDGTQVSLFSDFSFKTKADPFKQRGNVEVKTPLFEGEFKLNLDPRNFDDRYSLNAYKLVPWIDVFAQATYQIERDELNTGLSKSLTDEISANAVRTNNRSGVSDTFSLNYHLSF